VSGDLPDGVSVELDATELGGPLEIGTLRRLRASGGPVIAFAYEEAWLARPDAFVIDPRHGLYGGDQFPAHGAIAPVFADASTDRWGRTLLARREAVTARTEGRPRRTLGEWEYLLGVSDVSRMGALRFHAPDDRYLDDDPPGIPPMARLGELVAAAWELEQPGRAGDAREAHSLALLLAPGSSLGGARPKASFRNDDGSLWMAKFPSRNDTRDMGACEWVLNELAAAAGIEVPEHRLLALGTGHRTFAARRFDRAPGTRRLYASAMTLLSRMDREPASYLEIALAIADHGEPGRIEEQVASLFRRVVFNVLTAHRDDHLRNHGFLRTRGGWRLAPAFDLNAMPEKPEHELAIDAAVHAGDIDLVVETAPFYRLAPTAARVIVEEVRDALATWPAVGRSAHLGPDEIDAIRAAIDG
jgi:serine/threonine-protein kinase HipA